MFLNDAQKAVVAQLRKALKADVVTYSALRAMSQKLFKTEYAPQYIIKNPDMWAKDKEGNAIRGLFSLVPPVEFALVGRPAKVKTVRKPRKVGVSTKVEKTVERIEEAQAVAAKQIEKIARKGMGRAYGISVPRKTGTRG